MSVQWGASSVSVYSKAVTILLLICLSAVEMGVAQPQAIITSGETEADEPVLVPGPPERPSADAHYLDVPVSNLLEVLNDPDNRVRDDFKVPAALKANVGFWLKIYAKYSLYHTVIY